MVSQALHPLTHHTYVYKLVRRLCQCDEKNFFYHNIKTRPNIGISRATLKIICVDNCPDLIIFITFNNRKIKTYSSIKSISKPFFYYKIFVIFNIKKQTCKELFLKIFNLQFLIV